MHGQEYSFASWAQQKKIITSSECDCVAHWSQTLGTAMKNVFSYNSEVPARLQQSQPGQVGMKHDTFFVFHIRDQSKHKRVYCQNCTTEKNQIERMKFLPGPFKEHWDKVVLLDKM